MEAVATAAATSFVEWMVPKLFDFLHENHELRKNLEHDIKYIKDEFAMISAVIQDEQNSRHGRGEEVHKEWIRMVREVAHAIEDCIDRFMHRVRRAKTGAGWLRRAVHRVKTVKARNEFAMAIQELKKISEDASKLRGAYCSSTTSSPGRSLSSEQIEKAAATEDDDHSAASCPVPMGMDDPRDELLDLIRQQQQLKVITIVGFHGMGKTLLANHVYNYKVNESQYEARAWVPPTKLGGTAANVLREILGQLGHPTDGRLTKLQERIKECLGTKRFFIVIDGLQKVGYWHDIKVAFAGLSGRFLVTTTIQRVANTCSSSAVNDHVYTMSTLANQHSRLLFFKEIFQDDELPPDVEELGSEALKKCDGLPLALVTTARFLQSAGNPTPMKWAKLCTDLGSHLESDELFSRMRSVLVQSYTSLDSQVARTFLLYLSTYPSGRPIKRSTLIRKWLAEGFSPGNITNNALDAATSCFDKLVDGSIIQPIDASGDSTEVKTCHTHGMMLEFVIRKSMSDNFLTLCNQPSAPPLPSKIRRLTLHHATPREVNDLSLVRSLTVSGETHPSILDFSKYELMRVLDLEEYDHQLLDSHLKLVCSNLLLLRYLSLGAAVTALPKNIKKLQFLETLDVRRTNIEILPTQVMELPFLFHLFGKFKLKQDVGAHRMSKLQAWLSANSKLETVAGFVVDSNKSQGFAQLMDHMKHLIKVKIWYDSCADASSTSTLSKAIKGFIERSTNFMTSHALSLNLSGERSQDLLNFSLETGKSYYLCSLKLQGGNFFSLPPFVTMLAGLNRLCLSVTHQLSSDIIAALSGMCSLKQLKLTATQLDKHIIGKGAFRILQHLSITVEVMTELEIQDGALSCLKSLRLLCKDLDGFSGTSAIKYFKHLREIALHGEVGGDTKQKWKEAARKHPRCPKILFV
ncbi:disease resistance protein RGA4 [Aegilops tauschii subsp. strangulata]|uniref:Disease resistance protein RPM1 n=1 Tax=Aegilops tauschii subsp. strangulata TaxID=200361 RepID=A0A453QA06_AEGTS|nr:disease resistance protein RGA4 [Aegilops tauschii subsp. strangulata]